MRTGKSVSVARKAGRVARWVLGALLLAAVFAVVWVGARGALAYQHLERLKDEARSIAGTVATDPQNALPALTRLASEAENAHQLTSDPVWDLVEHVPWIGPQLAAFATVAEASERMFGGALMPLSSAAAFSSIDDLKLAGGRIDTSALAALEGPAVGAAAEAKQASLAVQRVNRTPLLGVVREALSEADELFEKSSDALDALSRATTLLPTMLGRDGPRSYLLLIQNNAEWRSLGGITGSAILVRTDRGTITLAGTRSATSLSSGIVEPVVQLPDEYTEIYGSRPARYFHNLTQIPDFQVDGPIAREMYKEQTGVDVNGVIAVDPVVLSYLLRSIGPVSFADGETLTADNAVSSLLKEVYLRYSDPAAQDAYFSEATGAVFDALLNGKGSTTGILTALARGVEERRVLMWAAGPEEQAVLAPTALAGGLPTDDERVARIGVFLNDSTGSKMSYYVTPHVAISWGTCSANSGSASRQLTLTLSLTNGAPMNAQSSLPPYVTGNGVYGVAPGSASVVSNIYLPRGWELQSASESDNGSYVEGVVDGREVVSFGFDLAPQTMQTASLVLQATTSTSHAEATVTPTADANLSPTVTASCGGGGAATLE